jgi:hypothetical protein
MNPTEARKRIVQTYLQTGSACRGVRSYAPTCALTTTSVFILGMGLGGRTPYECGVALGFAGSKYVGLIPVV